MDDLDDAVPVSTHWKLPPKFEGNVFNIQETIASCKLTKAGTTVNESAVYDAAVVRGSRRADRQRSDTNQTQLTLVYIELDIEFPVSFCCFAIGTLLLRKVSVTADHCRSLGAAGIYFLRRSSLFLRCL